MVKKGSFYLAIFNYIKNGKNPSFISKELNISKQKVYYYTKILKKEGFIGKKKDGYWFIKVKTFSLGTRPTTNLHALRIHIPVSSGNIGVEGWDIKEELKNWVPRYKSFSDLGGITMKNNNNKSITLFVHTRDIENLEEIDTLTKDVVSWATELLWRDFSVKLERDMAEVKMLHIATEDKASEGMRKKGQSFELDLDKKAEKILPKDNIDGKAWIDGSPFAFTAETNDKAWMGAYLKMPFSIMGLSNSMPALAEYNKNLKLHIQVQEEIRDAIKELKETLKKK